MLANNADSDTFNAAAIASNVPSDAEIWPVSIFDSIPVEIYDARASSAPVSPRRVRAES